MNQYLSAILAKEQVRQNLSALRKEITQPDIMAQVRQDIQKHTQALLALLQHEDAKTRKNAALLMGDLALDCCALPLLTAYQAEGTLFVKSAYLTALQAFDCTAFVPVLQERQRTLQNTSRTPENDKHIREELQALSALVLCTEGMPKHTFTGFGCMLDCVLLTNRLQAHVTADAVQHGEILPFPTGVRVRTDHLAELLSLRTYSEWLLVIPDCDTLPNEPVQAAKILAQSPLCNLLYDLHAEKTPFACRIEMKTTMSADKKGDFIRKMADALAVQTQHKLINSTSQYEVEIRLIANKAGTFHVLCKLFTLPDTRFAYRKQAVAASMRPAQAALLVHLAKPYMMQRARVLDPFCGVGTLLLERHKQVGNNTAYGIDCYATAIEKAKENTEAAAQIVHYINKDCLEFAHEYQFDEIFTNMPSVTAGKSEREITNLYCGFFPMAKQWLTAQGTMILYSHDPWLVSDLQAVYGYQIVDEFEIMRKQQGWLFILKFQ